VEEWKGDLEFGIWNLEDVKVVKNELRCIKYEIKK
jgi:hypothetical protein